MSPKLFTASILATFLLASSAFAATYTLDKDHTTVGFKVKHLFTWVNGTFDDFEGVIEYDPEKPETWKVSATIKSASINTRLAARDKHLKGADFFDAETYPVLKFTSTQVTDVTSSGAKLHGNLTIHGVEKPVVLDLQILGVVKDPWGNTVAGFSASTKINRKDFGLTWNQVAEAGQLLVGEEVEINLEVSGLLQESPAEPAAAQ